MPIPLVTLDQTTDLVCSEDSAVTLKFLPVPELTDEEKAAGKKPPEPVRESRRPIRWLTRDEVESIGPGALIVTVRTINSDEQFGCTGGFNALTTRAGTAAAANRATSIAVKRAGGMPGVDARTPEEVQAFVQRLPMVYREQLGEWILNDCVGTKDPFASPS